jgi:type VI secretion system FHA domain protein
MRSSLRVELESTGEQRRLSDGSMKIGRGRSNDWMLPMQTVSGEHCSFSAVPDGFVVTDLESTNGTRLNGRPLKPHEPTPLSTGDVVEIGPYRLVVSLEGPAQDIKAPSANSFAYEAPPPTVRVRSPEPGDLDAGDTPRSLDDWMKSFNPGSLSSSREEFELPPPDLAGGRHPTAADGDPFVAQSRPQDEALPLVSRFPSRREKRRNEGGADDVRDAVSDPRREDPESVLAAFLEGAGIGRQTLQIADERAFMLEAGKAFARMADGLRELLSIRALIKNEARLERTQVGASGNNPLKFSANRQEAVQVLLHERGQGYLPPLAAIASTLEDLKVHELALLEGLQSAIRELLRAFDPVVLEQKLAESATLALLVHGGRRAKLWELYSERYAEIAKAARSRFLGNLDEAFRAAYSFKSADLKSSTAARRRESDT